MGEKESVTRPLFLASGDLLAVLPFLGVVNTIRWCVPCVGAVFKFSLFIRILVILDYSHSVPVCLHLNYFCLQQPYFQIMSPQFYWGLVLENMNSWGHNSTCNREADLWGNHFSRDQIIDKTAELESGTLRWRKQKSVGQTEIDGPQGQMKCLCWEGKSKAGRLSSMCPRSSAEGGLFCTLLPGPTLFLFSPELYGKLVYFSSLLMKRIITERKKAR